MPVHIQDIQIEVEADAAETTAANAPPAGGGEPESFCVRLAHEWRARDRRERLVVD